MPKKYSVKVFSNINTGDEELLYIVIFQIRYRTTFYMSINKNRLNLYKNKFKEYI